MLLILFGEKTCKKNDKKIISMVKNVLLSLWFEIQQVGRFDRSPVIDNNDRNGDITVTVTVVVIAMILNYR